MVEKLNGLIFRWFDVPAKAEKQELEQVVHITWERSSIYFDTVKVYPCRTDNKEK